MREQPTLLIVDFGSQFTLLIQRSLRDLGFQSKVLAPSAAGNWLEGNQAKGIILSGSDKSVSDGSRLSSKFLEAGVPVLGICYGMHCIAAKYGAEIKRLSQTAEFGPIRIVSKKTDDPLLSGIMDLRTVWASHMDTVISLGPKLVKIAQSESGVCQVIKVKDLNIWGVQFHPEVDHGEIGKDVLLNFANSICKCEKDWIPENEIDRAQAAVRRTNPLKAVIGFSGGVDSTTLASVVSPVLGDRLLAICIDAGHLREGELLQIKNHAKAAGVNLRVISEPDRFISAISRSVDAEDKRRAFRSQYLDVLSEAANEFGASHVIQGTLASDLIESGDGVASHIKTHHNVALEWGKIREVAPFSHLFKSEVRDIAKSMSLPSTVVQRRPFLGPGLFLRIVGAPVSHELLKLVRWADTRVNKILSADPMVYDNISHLVVALICANTTGVKGDARIYGPSVLVRAVTTLDFMTAEPQLFDPHLIHEITASLTQHPEISRVWWDFSPKPPATIELE